MGPSYLYECPSFSSWLSLKDKQDEDEEEFNATSDSFSIIPASMTDGFIKLSFRIRPLNNSFSKYYKNDQISMNTLTVNAPLSYSLEGLYCIVDLGYQEYPRNNLVSLLIKHWL